MYLSCSLVFVWNSDFRWHIRIFNRNGQRDHRFGLQRETGTNFIHSIARDLPLLDRINDGKLPLQQLETLRNLRKELAIDQAAPSFHIIGIGSSGVVVSHNTISSIFKRELPQSDQLGNDLITHETVKGSSKGLDKSKTNMKVPRCYGYINSSKQGLWASFHSRFPQSYRHPGIYSYQSASQPFRW